MKKIITLSLVVISTIFSIGCSSSKDLDQSYIANCDDNMVVMGKKYYINNLESGNYEIEFTASSGKAKTKGDLSEDSYKLEPYNYYKIDNFSGTASGISYKKGKSTQAATMEKYGRTYNIRAYAIKPEIEETKMVNAQKMQMTFTEKMDKTALEK